MVARIGVQQQFVETGLLSLGRRGVVVGGLDLGVSALVA